MRDCNREYLEGVVDGYFDALVRRDPTKLPAASNIKYTENHKVLPIGDGIWRDAERLSDYRIYAADPRAGQIGFMGAVLAAGEWTMIALRLKVREESIVEAEAVLPGRVESEGTFTFGDAAAKLTVARSAFSTPLRPEERRERARLIQVADLHYEGIERGNGDIVPFSEHCIKIENGVQLIKNPDFAFPAVSPSGRELPNFAAMDCHEQFNTHIWDTDSVTDRRYPVVDEERGIVMAFVMYNQYAKSRCADVVDYGIVCPPGAAKPGTLILAEAFKVKDGEIHEVEAVFTALPALRFRGVW